MALLAVLGNLSVPEGSVFFAAVGAYFVVRQGLLRIRAEPRTFLWRRSDQVAPGSA